MSLRSLLVADDAVSPIIGVILMVAITVILAAIVATFVLGFGESEEVAPQVNFDYDYDEEEQRLTITVRGGDAFVAEQVTFRGENLGQTQTGDQVGDNPGATWAQRSDDGLDPRSEVRSGDSATLGPRPDAVFGVPGVQSEFELDIVWSSEAGTDSSVVATRTGPDA